MIEKCPSCNEKVEILPTQEPLPDTASITGSMTASFTFTGTTGMGMGQSYASTSNTYKCSNPKCWVTKINESWD